MKYQKFEYPHKTSPRKGDVRLAITHYTIPNEKRIVLYGENIQLEYGKTGFRIKKGHIKTIGAILRKIPKETK